MLRRVDGAQTLPGSTIVRPKTSGRDLPPRMLRRRRVLKSGKEWIGYYYNLTTPDGTSKEIPLGTDLNEAKRKWAELEGKPVPSIAGEMAVLFNRYIKEVIPTKAPRTQKDNNEALTQLRRVFDSAPINAITPQHIAQYRDHRTAKVRANREISLLSHIFNMAREWGYTANENPCRGVRKNKETPRAFDADDTVWFAVYNEGTSVLRNAMDMIYLSGQRPADVCKFKLTDIKNGSLEVTQNKTKTRLRIQLNRADGSRSELGQVIDRIIAESGTVISTNILVNTNGDPLTQSALRHHFDNARLAAIKTAEANPTRESAVLIERIKQFQFRDGRPKAATEINDLAAASDLLGHSDQRITKRVYMRRGTLVKPTK